MGGARQGFTLLEVLVASVVMLVGMVAVAQLVPISLTVNSGNRTGSTAMVIGAAKLLEQMLDQPLTAATCAAPSLPGCAGERLEPGRRDGAENDGGEFGRDREQFPGD